MYKRQKLRSIEAKGRQNAAAYYASIATINTQLQTGTTPGNPRLIKKLDTAQYNLNELVDNVSALNALAVEVSDLASRATYLLNTTQTMYSLSGAVEEDHARLASLEDQINTTTVSIDRILNDVNDNVSRTSSYLATERNNLRTLSLAVSNGDLYGGSLANSTPAIAAAPMVQAAVPPSMAQSVAPRMNKAMSNMGQARPLAKIKFDRPDVNYQQPVYNAIQQALTQYPNAQFQLVAVHPSSGNAAQVAIESTRARRNAERVLRTLTQMGIPLNKVNLGNSSSTSASSNEVHLMMM